MVVKKDEAGFDGDGRREIEDLDGQEDLEEADQFL